MDADQHGSPRTSTPTMYDDAVARDEGVIWWGRKFYQTRLFHHRGLRNRICFLATDFSCRDAATDLFCRLWHLIKYFPVLHKEGEGRKSAARFAGGHNYLTVLRSRKKILSSHRVKLA